MVRFVLIKIKIHLPSDYINRVFDDNNIEVIGSFSTNNEAEKAAANHAIQYSQSMMNMVEQCGDSCDDSFLITMKKLRDSNQFDQVVKSFYRSWDDSDLPHRYQILTVDDQNIAMGTIYD